MAEESLTASLSVSSLPRLAAGSPSLVLTPQPSNNKIVFAIALAAPYCRPAPTQGGPRGPPPGSAPDSRQIYCTCTAQHVCMHVSAPILKAGTQVSYSVQMWRVLSLHGFLLFPHIQLHVHVHACTYNVHVHIVRTLASARYTLNVHVYTCKYNYMYIICVQHLS